MINFIVDNQHVSTSITRVLRVVISKLKGEKTTWYNLDRKTRRNIFHQVVKRHNSNRQTYREVMHGG